MGGTSILQIWDQILKIDFFSSDRILQFSPASFDGSRHKTSQTIKNFLLYKKI
jgi:hypothetical protein